MARITYQDSEGKNVNLAEIRSWDGVGGGLPPGDYLFEIESVEQTQSSKGNPQLHLVLSVVAGAETETENGNKMHDWRPLRAKKGGLGRTKALIEACGLDPDNLDDADLVGRQFWAEAFEDDNPYVDATGQEVARTRTRLRNERAVEGQAATAAPAPAPVPAPAPAPAPAAPARAQAPQVTPPRIAGRAALPVPPRKR